MTRELLDAYFAEIAPSQLVPSDPTDAYLLLDLYIFEKGLYEVRYEIAHRPGWLAWPLSAVVDMIEPVAVR
jgi:predicted trehalose synthase